MTNCGCNACEDKREMEHHAKKLRELSSKFSKNSKSFHARDDVCSRWKHEADSCSESDKSEYEARSKKDLSKCRSAGHGAKSHSSSNDVRGKNGRAKKQLNRDSRKDEEECKVADNHTLKKGSGNKHANQEVHVIKHYEKKYSKNLDKCDEEKEIKNANKKHDRTKHQSESESESEFENASCFREKCSDSESESECDEKAKVAKDSSCCKAGQGVKKSHRKSSDKHGNESRRKERDSDCSEKSGGKREHGKCNSGGVCHRRGGGCDSDF